MLVPTDARYIVLEGAGVPHGLLDALDRNAVQEALSFVLKQPESAYWYYERNPEFLRRYGALSVVPLGEGPNGDEFFDLVFWEEGEKFVINHLEGGWSEIGPSPRELAVALAVRGYELHDHLAVEEIAEQLERLGFPSVLSELKALERGGA